MLDDSTYVLRELLSINTTNGILYDLCKGVLIVKQAAALIKDTGETVALLLAISFSPGRNGKRFTIEL